MKKLFAVSILLATISGCGVIREFTALTKCEFRFHSAQEPSIAGIDMMQVRSFSDLSIFDGQKIVASVLQKKMPFQITANVEARNPGQMTAAVNYIDWIAYIDDIEITTGRIDQRVEIAGNGGSAIIPIVISADLFEYLKGDNPKTMLNFGLNLVDAGGQPTRLSLKIKPSVAIGNAVVPFPNYFTISKVFESGN